MKWLGILVFATVMLLGGHAFAAAASTPECDGNAIIYCGFTSPADFIKKVRSNYSGNNHTDLQTVYTHAFAGGQALLSSQYDTFAKHAVKGTVGTDGRLVVGGKTVATGVKALGREASQMGAGARSVNVSGQAYYANTPQQSMPAYVLFDASNTVLFAVASTNGSPLFGSVVQTSASCGALTVMRAVGTAYTFVATAHTRGAATPAKYVFGFGDGETKTITSDFGQNITHTYTAPGVLTATVDEYVQLPTGTVKLASTPGCTQQVTIAPMDYACTALAATATDKASHVYTFAATVATQNGVVAKQVVFSFGDGKHQTVVVKDGAATVVHELPNVNGTYTVAATAQFIKDGHSVSATSAGCHKTITIANGLSQCRPGVLVGSAKCTLCSYDASLTAADPKCKAVDVEEGSNLLVNGAATLAVLAIIGGAVYLWKKH